VHKVYGLKLFFYFFVNFHYTYDFCILNYQYLEQKHQLLE
jgi:hypothetical protein